jgi:hypothetical protein
MTATSPEEEEGSVAGTTPGPVTGTEWVAPPGTTIRHSIPSTDALPRSSNAGFARTPG